MTGKPLIAAADAAAQADGVDPLNEASRMALAAGAAPRLEERIEESGRLIAAAYAPPGAHVELFVEPRSRRRGHGRRLLDRLLAAGERDFWAHGDLPAARGLAAAAGLERSRVLLILSRSPEDLPAESPAEGVVLRTWRSGDAEDLLAVNARAFADHPEQGAMDADDLASRMAQPWFDPAGLFIAEAGGRVVGFHWTKIEGSIGEVYVVAVDPDAQGLGLGRALTLRGLHHLTGRGVERIDLYVEGDNAAALATYRSLGFVERARDAVYSLP